MSLIDIAIYSSNINTLSYYSVLPCSVYCLFLIYSYLKIKIVKLMKNRKLEAETQEMSSNLLSQTQISIPYFNEMHSNIPYSFYIKYRLSILVALFLFFQIIFEMFCFLWIEPLNFLIIHIFEFLVWILSIILYKKDFTNQTKSKFYKNGLFWVLSLISDFGSIIYLLVNMNFFFNL